MERITRLLGYRGEESKLRLRPIKPNEKFSLSPRFSCTIKGGAQNFTAILTVVLGEEVSPAPTPFDLKASLSGNFTLGEDIGDDKEKQLRFAVETLFPYLRAYVSTHTALCGVPPFILPHIDVDAMASAMKSENTVYN